MPEADDIANELHTQIQYRLIEKLSESERRYRELVENLREIVFKCDRLGNLTFINRALTATLGYTVAEVTGKPLDNLIDPRDHHLWQEILETLLNSGNTCQELRFHHQNGAVVWLELSSQASQGVELSGSLINISDRKQAALFLTQANEQLEAKVEERTIELTQANQDLTDALNALQLAQSQLIQSEKMLALGQMVAGVAHEINNPVNFIHGNLAYISRYTQDLLRLLDSYQKHYPNPPQSLQEDLEEVDLEFLKEDATKILQSMKGGADRIRDIVISLRNFSRLDESEFKLVNIHEGIDNTLMILQHRLKAKAQRPAIKVLRQYGNLPLVECYASQLNQVFMNILINAIDALESRYIANTLAGFYVEELRSDLCIRISSEQLNSSFVIRIADNGSGMSEEVQKRLFDPFFTTKPVGKGTGMGLSISYQIITEKHGGSLQCFSTLGVGTEFVIAIPKSLTEISNSRLTSGN